MGWALVDDNITGMGPSGSTSAGLTAGSATFFIGGAGSYQGLNSTFDQNALSDSLTNGWNGNIHGVDGLTVELADLFYATRPVSAGNGQTFTLGGSHAANTFPSLWMSCWTGNLGGVSSILDQSQGTASVASGTSVQPPVAITPTEANCLITYVVSLGAAVTSPVCDSGFTLAPHGFFNNDGTSTGLAVFYLIQGAAAAVQPTASWTGASNAAAVIASWKSDGIASNPPYLLVKN